MQVDVTFLTLKRKRGGPVRRYQYTAIDDVDLKKSWRSGIASTTTTGSTERTKGRLPTKRCEKS